MIVPRSSQFITQDNEYGLFTVSLFKKVVEEFKHHAREKKFIVRDFTYNEEELAAGKNEITKLVTDKKKQFVRWGLVCGYCVVMLVFCAGPACEMAQGQFQWVFLCLDSRQSLKSFRRISIKVSAFYFI